MKKKYKKRIKQFPYIPDKVYQEIKPVNYQGRPNLFLMAQREYEGFVE